MIEIESYEQARNLLNRAVLEKGEDYVYPENLKVHTRSSPEPQCVYFYKGTPSCIIGHVVSYLGGGPKDVTESTMFNQFIHVKDKRAEALLFLAQEAQDSGIPWGTAVRAAQEKAEGLTTPRT